MLALRHDLQDRSGVGVLGAHLKHRRAAKAIQRLYDHLPALLCHKRAQHVVAPRHDRRCQQVGEVKDVQLLVGFAQAARVVHQEGATPGVLQQLRGLQVDAVKRRVFAHQHGVKVRKWLRLTRRLDGHRRSNGAGQALHAPDIGPRLAELEPQLGDLADVDFVAAQHRLIQDGDGGVTLRFQRTGRIDDG